MSEASYIPITYYNYFRLRNLNNIIKEEVEQKQLNLLLFYAPANYHIFCTSFYLCVLITPISSGGLRPPQHHVEYKLHHY